MALQNMFIKRMENIINERMQILCNIQTEAMPQIVDQIAQNGARLRRPAIDLTIDVTSTVATKTTPTWTLPTTATLISQISNPEVATAAAKKQTLRQYAARKYITEPQRAPQAPRPTSALTQVSIHSPPSARSSMASMTVSGAKVLPLQQWTTIFRKGKTISIAAAQISKRETALERSIAAEDLGLAKKPSETKRQILFLHRAGTPPTDQRDALNITYQLNLALIAAKVPTHVRVYRLNSNDKGNLYGLIAPLSTSSIGSQY